MHDPKFLQICEQAARAGGEMLRHWATRFSVREKGPRDLVTDADLASQEAIRSIVLGAFPDHAFLGEEGGEIAANSTGYRWIVDPLDGTTNYVHGVPQYAVSVALEQAGSLLAATVYDPTSDECFSAARGQGAWLNGNPLRRSDVVELNRALVAVSLPAHVRADAPEIKAMIETMLHAQAIRRLGSAALNLAYVAAGRFDATWANDTKAWDVAAGYLLVQEAGGTLTDILGDAATLTRPRYLATGTAELHGKFLEILRKALA